MPTDCSEDTLLAFDYGTRRTGVALGRLGQSTPLTIIKTTKGLPDKESIDRLISNWQPRACIVGIPLGNAQPAMAEQATRFANWLEKHYSLPTELVDESYSSCVIERRNHEAIDDQSAALLLRQWYSQQALSVSR